MKGETTMMHREQFLKTHPNVKGEMVAYTRDGEKLGKVTTLNDDNVNIEKGFFFPRDFVVSYDDIVEVKGNEIIISRRGTELREWSGKEYEGWENLDALNRGEEIDIPLREEELQVHKSAHKAGEVRIKKIVRTEEQSFSIPVTKEDVVIEHIPAGEAREALLDESAFSEREMSIPLMEEDVEVSKQQKIRETVHAKKVTHTQQREVSGKVRKEDLEVETTEASPSGTSGMKTEE
jgi:uncharacterized protein (TIGR02271 family)